MPFPSKYDTDTLPEEKLWKERKEEQDDDGDDDMITQNKPNFIERIHDEDQYFNSAKRGKRLSAQYQGGGPLDRTPSRDSIKSSFPTTNSERSKKQKKKAPLSLRRTLSNLSITNSGHTAGHDKGNDFSYSQHHTDVMPPRKHSFAGSLFKRLSSTGLTSAKPPKTKVTPKKEKLGKVQPKATTAVAPHASPVSSITSFITSRRGSKESVLPPNVSEHISPQVKEKVNTITNTLEPSDTSPIKYNNNKATSNMVPRRSSAIPPLSSTSTSRRNSAISTINASDRSSSQTSKDQPGDTITSSKVQSYNILPVNTIQKNNNEEDNEKGDLKVFNDLDEKIVKNEPQDNKENEETQPKWFPLDTNLEDITDITKPVVENVSIPLPEPSALKQRNSATGGSIENDDITFKANHNRLSARNALLSPKKSHSIANLPAWSGSSNINNIPTFSYKSTNQWIAPQSWDIDQASLPKKSRSKSRKAFKEIDPLAVSGRDRKHHRLRGRNFNLHEGKDNADIKANTYSFLNNTPTSNYQYGNEDDFSDYTSGTESTTSSSSEEKDEDFYDIDSDEHDNSNVRRALVKDAKKRLMSSTELSALARENSNENMAGRVRFSLDDERFDKVEYELERYYKDFSDLDPKRHYAIRIFNTDDTFTTLSCTPGTTVEEMLPTLKKKFNITSQSNFQISLKVGKLSKILRPLSKPILVERKLLLLNGYRKSDPLHIMGIEDLSFVFKFLFHPVTPSHFTPEQEHKLLRSDFVHVDLRNMDLTTPPIIFYQHTSEIESLDVSNNANIFLPLEFIQSTIKLLSLRMVNVRASKFPANITEAYKLVSLELQRNFIKKVPSSISKLGNLTILNLQCNELDKLPNGFVQLKNLQLLDLSSNRFVHYPEVINSCTNLLQADLSYNKIQSLPESINQLVKLAKINLSHNKLTTITSLVSMKSLRTLNLRHNRITSMKTDASNLQNLFLTDNRISRFEDTLPKLRALEIQENPITSISFKEFYPMNMTSLSLNKAQLSSIPGELFTNLTRLEKLELNENNLSRLPPEISLLSKLIYLSVARNKLECFPPNFSQLTSLKSLDLHSNNIRDFYDGMEDIELNFLNISSNMFGTPSLEKPFYQNILNGAKLSKSLLFFIAADNQFDDDMWPFFNSFSNLQLLNLSYNNFKNASALKLQSLTELFLSGNKLATLSGDSFLRWSQLKTLMLNNNQLQTLPAELSHLSQLTTLDVGSNQLKYNISNYHYDWNWRNNKDLKYLNFSGNRRFEVRSYFDETLGADLSDMTELNNLKVLGLMDVTLNTTRVPDESSNFRLRTTASVINGMRYGVADTLGQRDHVSVRDVTFERFRGKDDECLLCLHDGKNQNAEYGHNISRIVRDIYDKILIRQLEKYGDNNDENIKKALRFSFLQLNKEVNGMLSSVDNGTNVENLTSADLLSGACSTIIYIKGKKMFTANIGDCMGVLSKYNGDYQILTKRHVPSKREEYERIRLSGGYVNNDRLDGVADVSRAVGFFDLLPHIHASPDISMVTLSKADEMLVVATHRLWDYMDVETACDIARENSTQPMLAAQEMKDHAIAYGCSEAITILCLALDKSTEGQRKFTVNKNSLMTRRTTFEDTTLRRLQPEISPPTGNLAVVFTDIKNSTLLWELFPNAMRTAIKTHNDIMRRQLRIFGGYEVKTEGDAFMVTFPTPIGALVWCLSVQLKLLDAAWPQEITSIQDGSLVTDEQGNKIYQGLSVRMGTHWGCPVPELDLVTQRMDYLGPVVNKAARVSGVADGGQITLSSDFISEFNKIMEYHKEVVNDKKSLKDVYGEEIIGEVLEKEIAMLENIGWVFFDHGEQKLKGLETKELVTIVYPKSLGSRHNFSSETEDSKSVDRDLLFKLRTLSNRLECVTSAVSGGTLEVEAHLEDNTYVTLDDRSRNAIMSAISDREVVSFLDHLVTRIESMVSLLLVRQRLTGLDVYYGSDPLHSPQSIFDIVDIVLKTYEEGENPH
ncbi:hypothetical protein KAFR_0J01020 [Kazachstania africana CBS 2517]|uniref:Adenylate cyclase n=1 Tax=Kazachstania africana (strain ATCC 22294 / BCRC 22015 / CBS 2517 / CECT 1963 / NBRC 1671 / NRRL Y-8276) TaxID=1071382 RepID=H2B0M0_KAZAF|nr:hypothetical protein KAFR_0J01020 [Kazachstania africana CBS 2517]CCF60170.1 hypothetical protein KAFR_0J01020 [Kazachstania africana CBS 2517]